MDEQAPQRVADVATLIRERNAIDAKIAAIIGRPPSIGHLGEWLASQLFDVELEPSAVAKAIDGRFTTGQLAGKTVNVKCYGKREGLLDMTDSDLLDYYLVITGPKSAPASSRNGVRPFRIDACYLFDARGLLERQIARGAKVGIAASVLSKEWDDAEVYPRSNSDLIQLSPEARRLLRLFAD